MNSPPTGHVRRPRWRRPLDSEIITRAAVTTHHYRPKADVGVPAAVTYGHLALGDRRGLNEGTALFSHVSVACVVVHGLCFQS